MTRASHRSQGPAARDSDSCPRRLLLCVILSGPRGAWKFGGTSFWVFLDEVTF